MPLSLILACLWALGANVLAMTPSRDKHWRAAFGLIAVGIPIVGFVTYQNGPLIGLLCLLGAMSVLRFPVIYLWRWVRSDSAPTSTPELAED
ncbi:DUF2484 family protein [Roseovarius sp. D0-M9]|uniref:DUF2484 family protein n=1 Tax=Roseovarius sp. D0-M9 TaxID=3127117 RepID=UPI003010060B